jgi:site-specific DNA-methyltransferase (adenine-specific)
MLNDSLFMSNKDDWETPKDLYAVLNTEFNFSLDPCCSKETAKCSSYYTIEDDGLSKDWKGTVFMNPPYGRGIINWIKKAKEESDKGSTVVCLIPARTDTKWWHTYCMKSAEIRLLTKRLTFEGANNKATFPAAIIVFRQGENKPILKAQSI